MSTCEYIETIQRCNTSVHIDNFSIVNTNDILLIFCKYLENIISAAIDFKKCTTFLSDPWICNVSGKTTEILTVFLSHDGEYAVRYGARNIQVSRGSRSVGKKVTGDKVWGQGQQEKISLGDKVNQWSNSVIEKITGGQGQGSRLWASFNRRKKSLGKRSGVKVGRHSQ